MALSPQEKVLVDRILNEEIRWRVHRWFALLQRPALEFFQKQGLPTEYARHILSPLFEETRWNQATGSAGCGKWGAAAE